HRYGGDPAAGAGRDVDGHRLHPPVAGRDPVGQAGPGQPLRQDPARKGGHGGKGDPAPGSGEQPSRSFGHGRPSVHPPANRPRSSYFSTSSTATASAPTATMAIPSVSASGRESKMAFIAGRSVKASCPTTTTAIAASTGPVP